MYQKTTLDNRLRVITIPMPQTRSVSICFFIGTGSRYETEGEAGASHFIEHLLFKGTAKRQTATEISTAIEGVGGILNGGTDKELTILWSKVAQSHFHLALDVLVDMLLNAKFDPQEIERERRVILDEINMTKDFPTGQVNLLIDELLWPGHPLGRDVAGDKESVAGITRDVILNYAKSQYLPGNTVVTIAGNIPQEEAISAVSQAVASWTDQPTHRGYLAYQEQKNPRLKVERRNTEQAHLCLALPGLPLLHPKRFPLDLLSAILGEGMSSRLYTEIRDRLGLAYGVYSYVDHFLDSGSIIIYAGVEPKTLPTAITAILEQLSQLKEVIPESELVKTKELTKGRLLLRMEDSRSVAGWAGGQEILTRSILSVDEVASLIDAITGDELKKLARELLVEKNLRLAVVGPVGDEGSLEELLKL